MDDTEEENSSQTAVGGIISLILLTIIGVWIFNTFIKPDTWHGYFYPYPDNLTISNSSPVFDNLASCRKWATAQGNADIDGYSDYECGKNCSFRENYGVEVCQETIQ